MRIILQFVDHYVQNFNSYLLRRALETLQGFLSPPKLLPNNQDLNFLRKVQSHFHFSRSSTKKHATLLELESRQKS
jgi:hypothetical protein